MLNSFIGLYFNMTEAIPATLLKFIIAKICEEKLSAIEAKVAKITKDGNVEEFKVNE